MNHLLNRKGFSLITMLVLMGIITVSATSYFFIKNKNSISDLESSYKESKDLEASANSKNTELDSAEITSTSSWKTYTNDKYGVSFKYPPEIFIHELDRGEVVNFSRSEFSSSTSSTTKPFASFYVGNYALGKEYSTPRKVTPKEYFEEYYPTNQVYSYVKGVRVVKEWLTMSSVPVFYYYVTKENNKFVIDNRYVIFAEDRVYSFVLHSDGTLKESVALYTSDDVSSIKEIIGSLKLLSSGNKFVKIEPAISSDETSGVIKINGPKVLSVGQEGAWELSYGLTERFSVIWADGTPVKLGEGSGLPYDSEYATSSIFKHTFTKKGKYYVTFFARAREVVYTGFEVEVK